jgi:Copper type II ascorbate-dependent monooxygenase, C-terminal domain
MTKGNGPAAAMRAAVLGPGFACCAWVLACSALGQEAANGKKSREDQPLNPQKASLASRPVPPPKNTPTYTKDVAAILQSKCQTCHRRHQVGPFGLETYEQARKRSRDIAFVTEERSMPPWKPTRGVGPKLKHDQSLTAQEIETLAAWAEAGAPLGDPKDLPPPRAFAEGWKLGPPDLILEPAEGFAVPASGADVYRCFVLPTNLAQDTFVEAVDYAPTARGAVHHLIAYIDTTGRGRQLDADSPGPGYAAPAGVGFEADELSFWTAGLEPHRLPDGIGIRVPTQADILVQVHYHPSGKAAEDRTRVGLYLSRKPVKQALHWNNASSYDFRIPPGKTNVEVKASWMIPVDVEALAVSPHMHLLGHDMHMSVRLPNGKVQNLIYIANWDPSWQSAYHFQTPISLPAGSVVNVVAHFDNSAHSRNPNQPPKAVKFGPNFDDEMCVGYIALVKKGQDLTAQGARDDLFEIFSKQRDRLIRQKTAKKRR